MTEDEKTKAALEAQQLDRSLRSIQGGALLSRHNTAVVDHARQWEEATTQQLRNSQALFLELCRDLVAIGATQVNCGIFQATFYRKEPQP